MNREEMRQQQNTCPVHHSDSLGRTHFSDNSSRQEELGQYFTPVEVASYMASLARKPQKESIAILDPGSGSGVLSTALVKDLISKYGNELKNIKVIAYEIDERLTSVLHTNYINLQNWAQNNGICLDFEVRTDDFVLANSFMLEDAPTLFGEERFDYVISNPPYFKIPKDDPRAIAAKKIVYGQPNIYALFMSVAAALLENDGQLIFITPRSFCSGQYFKAFRSWFFGIIQPSFIHLFESRTDAFERDSVLQENIIFSGIKEKKPKRFSVSIAISQGKRDIQHSSIMEVSSEDLFFKHGDDSWLLLPSKNEDVALLKTFRAWKDNLETIGLKISTGPVVPFRAEDFLSSDSGKDMTALLWIQHVVPMRIKFPIEAFRKPQYIRDSEASKKLLVKNRNMILMRRFSPKEDFRRLTVAPYRSQTIKQKYVGLENHLNYIYKINGEMTDSETYGLAAFLNSKVFDSYFRVISGNTQVSATELRAAPLPSLESLREIGEALIESSDLSHVEIDRYVNQILGFSEV